MKTFRLPLIFLMVTLIPIPISNAAGPKFGSWALSFETGFTIPTETFDEVIDGDYSFGLNLEYMAYPYLGTRIAFNHQKFDYVSDVSVRDNLEFNSFAINGVIAYPLPDHFRLFAIGGPCYFSAEGQEILGFGEDGKDIGWDAGAGFEFFPILNWGIRFQSIYYSAEIGDHAIRSSWVDSVLGLTFRF